MGITKKINFESIFLFFFLILFPFGQIIRLSFNFTGYNIPLQPIDIVVGLAAVYSVVFQKHRTKALTYIGYFLVVAIFSYILNIFTFKLKSLYGLFYLIRTAGYAIFLNYVWNFVKKKPQNKELLYKSLLLISIITAIFGWIQFYYFPDIKPFIVYGWDMHLFRLVGTFLDSTYLGIILVLGLLVSIGLFIDSKQKKYLLLTFFLLVSIAFTYSRASYFALLAGAGAWALTEKRLRKIVLTISVFLTIIIAIPTINNHSNEFFRTFSITRRLDNYKTTLAIYSHSPVFGVGYNNMCVAYQKYVGFQDFASHACSGSDSSLLFILATTGIVGLLVFLQNTINISKLFIEKHNNQVVITSMVALFVHSLFSNSLFFPWVMGYMAILLAANIKE